MGLFLLAEIQADVSESRIGAVIFGRIGEISLSLDIITLGAAEQEGFHQVSKIGGNGVGIYS
jgi:hypothetical protein